ncbi:MAG: ATP-binding protein, partial [Bacteroidota bacterium]
LDRGTPAPGDTLRLRHDEAAFGVRFAAVDFRAPRQHRYRYRLVGLEEQWQRTDGTAPRAAYTGLAAGLYRFEVAGAAADTPFGTPTTMWIEVVPALWQTTAFQFSALLLAFALMVGTAVLVTRQRAALAAQAAADAAEVRRRLADARERERVRLARDLHDGPVQNLYRVGHDLDRLGESIGTPTVSPVRERVGAVARSLRQMLVELRPTLAEHLGLGPALKTVARHVEERHTGLTIAVLDEASGVEIDAASRVALFRIAQEALENVGRHAEASRARITLDAHDGGLRLTVRDNGRGFAVPERMVDLARQEHFGLVGAQERAEAVRGRFTVRSSPGRGTAVVAWVPAAASA